MILHTVMPPEVVWGAGQPGIAPGIPPAGAVGATGEVVDGPRRITLVRDADGLLRIHRLLSTEPRDYLDARWQPGRLWDRGEAGRP